MNVFSSFSLVNDSQFIIIIFQEIDDILAGGLTAEDEDDVLKELDQLIKVFCHFHLFLTTE